MALGDLVKGAAKDFVDNALGGLLGGGDSGTKQGFNAQNMISTLAKSGVAHTGHFEVQITANKKLQLPEYEQDMIFRAEAAELPGRTMATVDQRFDNYSPVQKVVVGQTYVDTTVGFLLSEDLREKEYFERWQDGMTQTGAFEDSNFLDLNTQNPNFSYTKHNVKYFHDYVGTVTIRQYGADGTIRSIHTLQEAYPLQMGGVSMSWNDDNFARMNVLFHYKKYKAVFYNQDQAKKGISGGFSLGPGGLSGSINVPGIGTFGAGGGRSQLNLGGVKKKIFSSIGF
jgi:hypothetical protein